MNLAYGPYELCRRSLAVRDLAGQSGLRAMVLPAALVSRLGADWSLDLSGRSQRAECLSAVAAAFELDGEPAMSEAVFVNGPKRLPIRFKMT